MQKYVLTRFSNDNRSPIITPLRPNQRRSSRSNANLMPIFFSQQCPTCGRPHRVNLVYLGQEVGCGHCHAVFTATGAEVSNHSRLPPLREQQPCNLFNDEDDGTPKPSAPLHNHLDCVGR